MVESKNASPEFKHLILTMLEEDPEKRATVEDVLNHPWLLHEYDLSNLQKVFCK